MTDSGQDVLSLTVAVNLSRALLAAHTTEQVERLLAGHVVEILGARTAHFLRYVEHDDTLRLSVVVGEAGVPPDFQLSRGQGVSWQVAERRKLTFVPSTGIPEAAVREPPDTPDMSLLYAPMYAIGGALLGVLAVGRVSPEFDERDVRLMEAYANVGSVALQRAREAEQNAELREGAMLALGLALEARDYETQGHTARTVTLARQLGVALGLGQAQLDDLRQGAYLHDIGKLSVPDEVLLKPGRQSDDERRQMQAHVLTGEAIVRNIPSVTPGALSVIRSHHERWDGRGYPDGLQGEAIPRLARLFAVVDVFDALTHDRPYHRAVSATQALAHLRAEAGAHFDPQVVAAFAGLFDGSSAMVAQPAGRKANQGQ